MKPIHINKWDKYNILTIIKEVEKKWDKRIFLCKCDCWNIKKIRLAQLLNWDTKSCWCLRKENISNKTHWLSKTRIWNTYMWIKFRCNNVNSNNYKNYWGRWIKNEWNTFEDFYEDMKDWYSDGLTIDRIDVNWNYCKENCRWSTMKEQQNNKRNNVLLTYKWITKNFEEWANIKWLTLDCIRKRYYKKWSVEKILTTPFNKNMSRKLIFNK